MILLRKVVNSFAMTISEQWVSCRWGYQRKFTDQGLGLVGVLDDKQRES